MRLLFDANISRRIVRLLEDLFPESTHVTLLGLPGETPDEQIWEAAKRGGFTIVTADFDFLELSERLGARPKVIRLDRMDYSTAVAATLVRSRAIAIAEFEKSGKNVMVLKKP